MKRRRPDRTTPKPAKSALVQIEKPIYGGAFLARLEGKATFVPLTLPCEQARIRIMEDKRSYATAEPEEIVSPSKDRVQPRCPHFGFCGGCSYQHSSYEAQLDLKTQILLETFQRAGVPHPEQIGVLAGEPWGYRNRIRLAFGADGRVGRAVASAPPCGASPRNVRTPQSRVVVNGNPGRPAGQCHRKQTAGLFGGR